MYDIIVIGGGPAGICAAIYARRANKTVAVIEKAAFGGQITFSPMVENIPGFASVTGNEFAEKLQEYKNYHTRVTVLGHVQRGGSPSARDRVLGSLFGYNAVQLLKEGKGGLCIGISGSQVVFNDIIETLERKRDVPYLSLYQINKEISF